MRRSQRLLWGTLFFVLVLGLAGCGDPSGGETAPPVVEAAAERAVLPPNLPVEEVHALYTAGEVVLLDVREPWEYEEVHIPGALLIPLGELPDRLEEVPSDEDVIIVCRSGNRSDQARRYLTRQGFGNVSNMLGGMLDWRRAGYEVGP